MESQLKSQTYCEAGTESQGSLSPREIAGPPGEGQSGLIVSKRFDYEKVISSFDGL
jgi:hypothetical protein